MRLDELLSKLPDDARPVVAGTEPHDFGPDLQGLAVDSRKIAAGYLFAALPSSNPAGGPDGRDFIPQALESGASAILVPDDGKALELPPHITVLRNTNPRRVLALMAAAFYGRQPATQVAVTGTNGKTSVATFTRQIWEALGHKAASLGTLGLYPELPDAPAALTTPDSVGLQACLARLADLGYEHLAMEASSHGLDQYRLDGVELKAAAFTNLTRDHLDYHGGMESYLAAKARLFTDLLPQGGTAVLNADAPECEELKRLCAEHKLHVLTYGTAESDLRIVAQHPTAEGQDLSLFLLGREIELHLPLAGSFQAGNVLAAVGLTLATGEDLDDVLEVLPALPGVPGRAELVGRTAKGGTVYVDYAHTPDAVETIIQALRPHTANKLSVIVGCGGDRDPGKRPMMGGIADELADRAYITDDNPRSEDPAKIRAQMMAAAPTGIEVDGRRNAIFKAVAELEAGDLLIIAGKGHETGQIVGDKVLPFDDREVAREAIAATDHTAADRGDEDATPSGGSNDA